MRSIRTGKQELKTNIAFFVQELAHIQGHFEKMLRLYLFSASINFIEQQYCSTSITLFNVQAYTVPLPKSYAYLALCTLLLQLFVYAGWLKEL